RDGRLLRRGSFLSGRGTDGARRPRVGSSSEPEEQPQRNDDADDEDGGSCSAGDAAARSPAPSSAREPVDRSLRNAQSFGLTLATVLQVIVHLHRIPPRPRWSRASSGAVRRPGRSARGSFPDACRACARPPRWIGPRRNAAPPPSAARAEARAAPPSGADQQPAVRERPPRLLDPDVAEATGASTTTGRGSPRRGGATPRAGRASRPDPSARTRGRTPPGRDPPLPRHLR